MRRALLALALVVAGCVTAPPVHATPATSVIVVRPETSARFRSSFATVPGAPYVIVATGVYTTLDSRSSTRMGDCGWWFGPHGGSTVSSVLQVDDHAAGCSAQPYSPTHTYTWTETGTGAPFYFSLLSVVGAITVTVEGEALTTYDVTSHCTPHPASSPLLDYVPVAVEAGADATEPQWAASTYVVCDISTGSGAHLSIRLGLPGPTVRAADRIVVPPGDTLHVCWYAGAEWGPTPYDVTSPTTCEDYTV